MAYRDALTGDVGRAGCPAPARSPSVHAHRSVQQLLVFNNCGKGLLNGR